MSSYWDKVKPWECAACHAQHISANKTACPSCGTPRAGSDAAAAQDASGQTTSIFKDAVVTFVPDPAGAVAGKTQYLSRLEDEDGSQYVAQVKGDECYAVELINRNKQMSPEAAKSKMESLLPESVVSSAQPVVKTKPTSDVYWWTKKFRGEVQYTDSSRKSVSMISATRVGVF